MQMKDDGAGQQTSERSYRTIPVDVLREFYRDHVELSSLTQVAMRVGLGKTTLHSFLKGTNPVPRNRRALAIYYVRAQATGPREDALDALSDGDEELKDVVIQAMVEHHRRHGRTIPLWLEMLQRRL